MRWRIERIRRRSKGMSNSFGPICLIPQALDDAIGGCDTAIHLIGIIKEKPRPASRSNACMGKRRGSVVESAKRAGVKRFIHMSALGVRADAASDYRQNQMAGRGNRSRQRDGLDDFSSVDDPRAAEANSCGWKPVGPGKNRRRFCSCLILEREFWVWAGRGVLQPVFVDDVARAFVDASAIRNPSAEPTGWAARIG